MNVGQGCILSILGPGLLLADMERTSIVMGLVLGSWPAGRVLHGMDESFSCIPYAVDVIGLFGSHRSPLQINMHDNHILRHSVAT